MFAIVAKSDGYPVSRHVGAEPNPLVVTWASDDKAKAFLAAKGIESEYQVVALTEASLKTMADALGCEADAIGFDAYPES